MATYTDNYNLELPEEDDMYDISVFNENMETVDTILAETEQNLNSLGDQMETATNEIKNGVETINQHIGTSENETVFGLLNQISTAMEGLKLIKSIQYVDYIADKTTSGSANIKSVTPAKCIVLMDRLSDGSNNGVASIDYTLKSSSISCSHGNAYYIKIRFWVVEFY